MATVDTSGLYRIAAKVESLARIDDADVQLLMEEFGRIMIEDNRKGILEGTGGDGVPLAPVTYRPVKKNPTKFPGFSGGAQPTKARTGAFGLASGAFKGTKTATGGTFRHGNLTTAQYRKLDGPPLAPRYDKSRVITNYKVGYGKLSDTAWESVGAWDDVVSITGRPFLLKHFRGEGRLRRRDLRHIRPWGRQQARDATRKWIRYLLDKRRSA